MAQQKLYTKEMFLIAAEKCEVSMIDAQHIMKYIDEYVTPIELPSDEDLEKAQKEEHLTMEEMCRFEEGVEWVIKQILNQNK